MKRVRTLIFSALVAGGGLIPQAHAGLFDDTEARQQLAELRSQSNARLDRLEEAVKGQIQLASQIEAVRDDVARLLGQVEVLTYELEQTQKRQKDFYIDLDERLRKLEAGMQSAANATGAASEVSSATGGAPPVAPPPVAPPVDPAKVAADYEAALNSFKAAKYREAATGFELFAKSYPRHELTPSAQYWLGNAWYALRDCKKAIVAHHAVVSLWPDSSKAPESLLSVMNCQQELGDTKAAKITGDQLLARYPASEAAQSLRARRKK